MKKIYGTLALLLMAMSVDAAPMELSLEECRTMALESSYKLRSNSERIEASKDMLAAYRTNHLPSLSLSGNYLYSTMNFSESISGGLLPLLNADGSAASGYAYMPDMNFDIEVGSIYNVGARVVQPIYLGGKVSNAVKLAQIGVNISSLALESSEASLLVATDEAYYTCLKLEQMLLSAESYRSVVEEFYRQVEGAVRTGMSTRNELLKVEVRLNEATLLRQKAQNGLRLARMNLCYTIGLPLSTRELILRDDFDGSQVVDSENLDISQRPEYAMLEQQIEARELEMKIARSEFLPSVSALASYGYANGATINGAPLVNGASFGAGVMVNVPIFHWGKGRRTASAKSREVSVAQSEMEDKSRMMSLELMQAIGDYEDATLELTLTESAVVEAEENMRISEREYMVGMESIADSLEAQALWQQALSRRTEARAAQRSAFSRYQRAMGVR